MRYLITGATGFIGSKIIENINLSKINISTLGRNKYKKLNNDFYKCDLAKDSIPNNAFENVDVFIHCAGLAHDTAENIFSKDEYDLINYKKTIELAQAAISNNVSIFIFISSVKASPYNKDLINDESSLSKSCDFYGDSKRKAEIELLSLSKSSNMKTIIIRPTLVYGINVGGNIEKMIKYIDYNIFPSIPNIKNRRSMVHIDNLVDIIFQAINKKELENEIIIVSDERDYSTYEIYNLIFFYLKNRKPYFSFPLIFFKLISLLGDYIGKLMNFPFNSKMYRKLFDDEYYLTYKVKQKFKFERNLNFENSINKIILNYKINK